MGKKFYLTEFENGGVRFFGSSEAKKRWPNMIIEYLEPMLQVWIDSVQFESLDTIY